MRTKLERDAAASETWAKEVATRRPLSKSSLRRAEDAEGAGVDDAAPAPRYKQDTEAYKRRPGVKGDVMKLLKQGSRVLGFKVI